MHSPKAPRGITLEEFQKFREFFYRKTGLYFDDNKRYFVDKRLVERIRGTDSDSFREYFVILRFETDGKELQNLVNLMTVNETYFYREEYQMQCLVQSILTEIVSERQDTNPIKIWSVPCSTGEEPYSIAIYLLQHWPGIHTNDVELTASDIDTVALAAARAGEYGFRSIAQMPKKIHREYFNTIREGRYIIKKDLRESINFTQVNIIEQQQMRRYRDFDCIFCRNLLIYFDDKSRRLAAENLYDALRPGGFICLGHSESMSRISPLFQIRKFPETIVYQKPY